MDDIVEEEIPGANVEAVVAVSPVADPVVVDPVAVLPEPLLLGASGDLPDMFVPVQFDTSDDSLDMAKSDGGGGDGYVGGSIYGGGLGKDKEEMDDDLTLSGAAAAAVAAEDERHLPVLGNPQGYENVAATSSLNSSTGSVYEPITDDGGAVSAYLGQLSSEASSYADGVALANSTHEREKLQASAPISARLGQLIDWNASFQEILDLPQGNEAQVKFITALVFFF